MQIWLAAIMCSGHLDAPKGRPCSIYTCLYVRYERLDDGCPESRLKNDVNLTFYFCLFFVFFNVFLFCFVVLLFIVFVFFVFVFLFLLLFFHFLFFCFLFCLHLLIPLHRLLDSSSSSFSSSPFSSSSSSSSASSASQLRTVVFVLRLYYRIDSRATKLRTTVRRR